MLGSLLVVGIAGPTQGQSPHVDRTPIAILGGEDTAPLGQVLEAARLGSSIVVLDGQGRELIAFELESGDARVLASRGQGPGELQNPRNLWVSGDTVFVYDSGSLRISGFNSGGDLLSERTVRVPLPVGKVLPLPADRWLLERKYRLPAERDGRPGRDSLTYFATDRTFASPQEFATVPGILSDAIVVRGRPYKRLAPFSPFPIARTWGRCVFLGVTDDALVRVFDQDGKEGSPIRLLRELGPEVSGELRGRFVEEQLMNLDEESGRLFTEASKHLSFPNHLPLFVDFLVDPRGWIWTQDYDPFSFPARWRVQSMEGQFISDVSLPVELDVHEIGLDYIVGSGVGELGRPLVFVLRLSVDQSRHDPRGIAGGCAGALASG